MVVCKFFQQGFCRYGQNCRFEHVYGSKYTYHAPQSNSQPSLAPASTAGVTDEQLVNQVQTDIQSALKGGQWVLSSYAPFKEKPALPGLNDLSPEEARLFIYEAKANNNIDQAVAYMNNLFKETRSKYEQLLQPTPSIIKVLRSLYKGEVSSSPFAQPGFVNQNSSAASSIFRSAAQNTSVFGQTGTTASSLFGQANSAFAQPNTDTAKSIFSQATQNVFGSAPNVFGQTVENVAAKSIFAQANQSFVSPVQPPPSNIFANATQQQFGQPVDVFSKNVQSSPFQSAPANVFQQPQMSNVFGAATMNADDGGVYSKPEQLSPEEIEMYTSDSFILGFIPELPPPQSLCV